VTLEKEPQRRDGLVEGRHIDTARRQKQLLTPPLENRSITDIPAALEVEHQDIPSKDYQGTSGPTQH
jgi:hypothetical protein